MTTPEALRNRQMRLLRRQRIEGALLVVIGIAMLLQSVYFSGRDDRQRECLAANFRDLSAALEVRAKLTNRETEAARRVNLAELRSKTEAEFVDELRRYERAVKAIQSEREEHPLPPYPPGRCDG